MIEGPCDFVEGSSSIYIPNLSSPLAIDWDHRLYSSRYMLNLVYQVFSQDTWLYRHVVLLVEAPRVIIMSSLEALSIVLVEI